MHPQNRRRQRRASILGGLAALVLLLLAGGWAMFLQEDSAGTAKLSELASFKRHEAGVRCLAVSTDGELVGSGDEYGSLLIWKARNRELLGTLGGHKRGVQAICFSIDGKLAASGDGEGTIRIWDLASLHEMVAVTGHRGAVTSLAFYPAKSHLISAGGDGRVALWKLADDQSGRSCELAKECPPSATEVNCLAIAPDGSKFLTGDAAGALAVWTLSTMQESSRFNAHQGAVRGVAISPLGGQALSCGDDGTVRRWDLEQARLAGTGTPPGDVVPLLAVAYSPGATRALSADARGIVRLWTVEDAHVLETFSGHTDAAPCTVFFPNGTIGLSGSFDRSVRLWQLPMPSDLETKQMAQAVEGMRHRSEQALKFFRQMELGQQAFEQKQLDQALADFRAAAASASKDSLEYARANQAATDLSANLQAMKDYESLCSAGKKAAENEDFAAAMEKFKQASKLLRGRGKAADQSEIDEYCRKADEAYDQVARLAQLKEALDGLKVTDQSLDFESYAPPKNAINTGRSFACLLTRENPPMATASTPLEWSIDIKTPVPFPDEKVQLRFELWHEASRTKIAEVLSPFESGASEQSLDGEARPPEGGWRAGDYQLRSTLVTPKKEIAREPVNFKLGVLAWQETKLELRPEDVLQAGFVVESGVKIEQGDALIVTADGTIAPGPLAFYRELLVNPKLLQPLASPPVGLPWHDDSMRINKYRMVDVKANYAALLLRVGFEGAWLAYRENAGPQLPRDPGPLQVSINSVVPPGFSVAGRAKTPSASEKSYWASNSGEFRITILRGKFDFPMSLSTIQRAGLLMRFKD
jgi:WD40 repeat protein